MAREIVATNLDLHTGVCIKLLGDIPPAAKHFRVDLGKDYLNIGLHFNARFRHLNETKTIVCNSIKGGVLGNEQRVKRFPFVPGNRVEISITFEGKNFKVKLPDGYEFTFPNRLNLETINFLSTSGDFKLRTMDII
ncbi:galectin-1-like [Dromiciops gliroides]|uniref:galectin-1-like n=1 Tax=Dromiciops gliroides TaxID=33562 RepID=UPI001CC383E5|nr:galectin-1-like [Dromiciops gliroides]